MKSNSPEKSISRHLKKMSHLMTGLLFHYMEIRNSNVLSCIPNHFNYQYTFLLEKGNAKLKNKNWTLI